MLIIKMDFIILALKILYRSVIFFAKFPSVRWFYKEKFNMNNDSCKIWSRPTDNGFAVGSSTYYWPICFQKLRESERNRTQSGARTCSALNPPVMCNTCLHMKSTYTSLQAIFIVKLPHVFKDITIFPPISPFLTRDNVCVCALVFKPSFALTEFCWFNFAQKCAQVPYFLGILPYTTKLLSTASVLYSYSHYLS